MNQQSLSSSKERSWASVRGDRNTITNAATNAKPRRWLPFYTQLRYTINQLICMFRLFFIYFLVTLINLKLTAQGNSQKMTEFDSNISSDTFWRPEVFFVNEVERMKQFFLQNTSLPEQPKSSLWNTGYRQKCINTVRAGLEILLFGSSSIPDSLYSRLSMFNGDFQTNDIQGLAGRLQEKNFLSKPDTLLFNSINKGEWVTISNNDEKTRYLKPIELKGSLWFTLLANIGKVQGYSVFVISICDGYHTAVLTVDHRNLEQIFVYWSDQTHKHPLRYIKQGKLIEPKDKYGWEVMFSYGLDTLKKGVPRGLDEYLLYAIKKFWCDCHQENQKPEDCCTGNCFPLVQLWRVKKSKAPL